jgi:hypothetical protein
MAIALAAMTASDPAGDGPVRRAERCSALTLDRLRQAAQELFQPLRRTIVMAPLAPAAPAAEAGR